MKWNLRYSVACVLGIVFIVSAIFKLVSVGEFELYVFTFGFMSFDVATVAARCLIIGEALLGFCFIVDYRHHLICWICSIVLGLFSVFLIWRLLLGDVANCHCFGEILDMNPKESLLKNMILGGMLAVAWRPFRPEEGKNGLLVLLVMFGLAVGVFIYSPPDVAVRYRYKVAGIEKEWFDKTILDEYNLREGRKVMCFYGASCTYCGRCAKKIDGVVSRHALNGADLVFIFMETEPDMTKSIADFFREYTEGRIYAYKTMPIVDFMNITKGVMPVVVFVEDGKTVGEYTYITLKEKDLKNFLSGATEAVSL